MALNYFHAIFKPAHHWMGLRTAREMETLALVLDSLADGSFGAAADLVAQRLKALERSTWDGHWERAQWVELLEPEGASLMEDDEQHMVDRESRLRQRWAKGKGKGTDKGPPPKGKGKKGGSPGAPVR